MRTFENRIYAGSELAVAKVHGGVNFGSVLRTFENRIYAGSVLRTFENRIYAASIYALCLLLLGVDGVRYVGLLLVDFRLLHEQLVVHLVPLDALLDDVAHENLE